MRVINSVTLLLLIVGGLNWGLVGLLDFDLVAALFGEMSTLSRIVYALVGCRPCISLFRCSAVTKTPESARPTRKTVPMPLDRRRIATEFAAAVNMTAAELRVWLKTDDSRRVGWKGADGARRESVGHASGRTIVEILGKRAGDLTDEDYAHMRKVVGFVRRHRAQEPHNIATSRWRFSLMNWGHDTLKSTAAHG